MVLERMRLFVRVAELGSLTKASAVLDMVQPVISRNISQLEQDVGGRLFHRTGRGVKLSALGEQLLPRAVALLREADDVLQFAKQASGRPSGEVRIGLLASFSKPVTSTLLRRVIDTMPGVRLKIFEGTLGRVDEWLSEGRIDIALNFRDSRVPLCDERRIATVTTYLIGPYGDPLLSGPTIDFKAINKLPLVLSATTSGLRTQLDELAQRYGIVLNPVVEIDSLHVHIELVRAGFGYAVMTPQAIASERRDKLISCARIVNPDIVRTIVIGTSTRQAPTLAVRAVADMLETIGAGLVESGVWQSFDERAEAP
jgi:LysR family transcriptional regulator, nitrogen assimilation regulatory protein